MHRQTALAVLVVLVVSLAAGGITSNGAAPTSGALDKPSLTAAVTASEPTTDDTTTAAETAHTVTAATATENHSQQMSAAVSEGLSTADGTQTIVVRLTEQPSTAIRATDHENRIRSMQSHAATTRSAFERFAEGNPYVEIKRSFWVTNALVVSIDTDRIPLQRLGTVDNVERIHENYNLSLAMTAGSTATSHPQGSVAPTRPQQLITQQPVAPQLEPTTTETTDGLAQINVVDAWEYTRGGTTSIAVLDTGVDPTHPDIDIDPANWNDWDTDGNPRDTAPQDYGSHGTHVSGTTVGSDASGTNIGVAPNAELYHGAALNQNCDTSCTGTVAQLYAGMEWAVDQEVDVISMSLGGGPNNYIQDLVPAVRNAEDAGTVVVAAAGNEGADTSISPGNIYDGISVSATTADGTIADFSSSDTISTSDWENPPADWPETYTVPTVAAPGSNIYSSLPDDRYGRLDGTSMATPHVSGTAALIQAASSESLSPDEIRSILESTAVDTGDPQRRQGAGQIDAGAAVETVVPRANFAVDIASAPTTITAGKQLTVDYTVENTGEESGSKQIVLKLDGEQIRSTTTGTLAPGDQTEGRFTYETTGGDVGTRTLTVASDNDSASRTIEIIEPSPNFAVDITTAPTSITAGRRLTVDYTVKNTGDKSDSQRVALRLDDTEIENTTVTLDPSDSVSGTFTYQTTTADVGTRILTVTSDDDSADRDVDLVEPTLRLANTSLEPDSVTTGSTNSYTLTADVYNVSDDGQPETVTISLPTALTLTDPIEATDVSATDTDGETVDIAVNASEDNAIAFSMSPDTDAELRDLTLTVNFTAQTNSRPTVSITNTSLEPDSATTGSTNNYTLTADVYNVSDDGRPETVTISLPTALTLTSAVGTTEVTATDTDGETVDVVVEGTDNNTITLSMSPDTDAELRDLTLTINFTAKVATTV